MASTNGRVPVWDAAVRVLHWTLASLVAFNLWRDDGDLLHRQIGYVAAGVVAARWAWAAFHVARGSGASLRPSLRATLAYLRALSRGEVPEKKGHDPLGLWMVWVLWLLVLLLGLTGWMTRWDMFWGDDDALRELHARLADALLVCVVVHLLGVVGTSWQRKENLAAGMITGRRHPVRRR